MKQIVTKLKNFFDNAINNSMPYRMESEEIDYPEDLFGSDSQEDLSESESELEDESESINIDYNKQEYMNKLQKNVQNQLKQKNIEIDSRPDLTDIQKTILKTKFAQETYSNLYDEFMNITEQPGNVEYEYVSDIKRPKRNPILQDDPKGGEEYPYIWQSTVFPEPSGKKIRSKRKQLSQIKSLMKTIKTENKDRNKQWKPQFVDEEDVRFSEYLRRSGGVGSLQSRSKQQLQDLQSREVMPIRPEPKKLRTMVEPTNFPKRRRRQSSEFRDIESMRQNLGEMAMVDEPMLQDIDYRRIRPHSQISKRERRLRDEYMRRKQQKRREMIEKSSRIRRRERVVSPDLTLDVEGLIGPIDYKSSSEGEERFRQIRKRGREREREIGTESQSYVSELEKLSLQEDSDDSIARGVSEPIVRKRGTRGRPRGSRGRARGTRERGRGSRGRARGTRGRAKSKSTEFWKN